MQPPHLLAALRREAVHVERAHHGELLVHVDARRRRCVAGAAAVSAGAAMAPPLVVAVGVAGALATVVTAAAAESDPPAEPPWTLGGSPALLRRRRSRPTKAKTTNGTSARVAWMTRANEHGEESGYEEVEM